MDKFEMMAEANRRGILPPEKKAIYEEAVSRGLVPGESSSKTETPMWQKVAQAALGKEGLQQGGIPGMLAGMGATGFKNAMGIIDETANEAGGQVTEIGSRAGLAPETAAKIGLATNVGIQTIPALLSGGAASKLTSPAIERFAEKTMQTAVKPNLRESLRGGAVNIARTLIDNGIAVTEGGLLKLKGKISGINDDISKAISGSTASVDKRVVAKTADDVLGNAKMQVSPSADTKAVNSVIDDFVNHPLIQGNDISVQLAQKLKQGTYAALKKKYGQMGGAEVETQKALARGLKEEIAKAVPDIEKLNAAESKLLSTMTPVERRLIAAANRDPGGLAWIARDPMAAVGFLAARSPAFLSYLSLATNAGAKAVPKAIGAGAYAGRNSLSNNQSP